jgi:hypothetical protein
MVWSVVMLCHDMLCDVMLCYIIFLSIMFYYILIFLYFELCYVMMCGVQASTQCRHSSLTILSKRMTKQATAMMVRHMSDYPLLLFLPPTYFILPFSLTLYPLPFTLLPSTSPLLFPSPI